MSRKLVRYSSEKKIAGVCSGIARYFGWRPNNVRVVWLLFTLLGGSGILFYMIFWLFMPSD